MMIEQKEAVIFDLDGTMTDSMWIWEEIDQDFFRQQGLPMPEHLHEEIEGMSFTETAQYFIRKYQLSKNVEEVKELWNRIVSSFNFVISSNVSSRQAPGVNKGKPEPDVYLKTAEKLAVSPQHCLVFEDIPMGILAGKRAGMTVCAVEDDYSALLRAEKYRLADYYITDYRQVLDHTYEDLRGFK